MRIGDKEWEELERQRAALDRAWERFPLVMMYMALAFALATATAVAVAALFRAF